MFAALSNRLLWGLFPLRPILVGLHLDFVILKKLVHNRISLAGTLRSTLIFLDAILFVS